MSEETFKKVVIIGPGLIGGSMGIDLKNRGIAATVVGVGHRESSLTRAVEIGSIDEWSLDAQAAVVGADLIVLATGVELIAKFAFEIAPHVSDGAIITDVGSTKARICATVEKALADRQAREGGGSACFVGSHPIAGSEKRGIEAARDGLFENALCIVVRTNHTDERSLEKIKAMWQALGSVTLELTPEEHDRRLARVSHLVHLAAAVLVNVADEDALSAAATGFLDTTRVASGDPALWEQICLSNRENILAALGEYIDALTDFKHALESSSGGEIARMLDEAKRRRDSLLERNRSSRSSNG